MVLTKYLDWSEAEALAGAQKFERFGPNLYSKSPRNWKELLGVDAAEGVRDLLLSMTCKGGAVPRDMRSNLRY